MISLREALELIEAHAKPLPSVRLPLEAVHGKVLADPLVASQDIPLFTQSAVDGYAVFAADTVSAVEGLPIRLRISGMVRAGQYESPSQPLRGAIKIFTGGKLPRGADAVLMKEAVREEGDSILVTRPVAEGENVRYRGEEFRRGAVVFPAGARITPPVLGLLAGFGRAHVRVHRAPTVTLAVTGDELIPPGTRLRRGQIYDSNSLALSAAIQEFGLEPPTILHLRDDRDATREALGSALEDSDVLITVGGISVGDYDLVKEALSELEVKTIYWRLAIKPGMPNYFGVRRKFRHSHLVFGLPGNPVAALLSFHQLVKPALARLRGYRRESPVSISARLAREARKKPGRMEWVRARLREERGELVASPLEGQGSHMLGGLAEANCLIRFPLEEDRLEEGAKVEVELLSWRD
ncbi:MAG: molybdopterin molybdotransferase MoeA [Candidatus Omnitrophica bacterium]|nr:molybdopterin molybdotransferase MoeA [Candidatus Omnitrophota bacterium]